MELILIESLLNRFDELRKNPLKNILKKLVQSTKEITKDYQKQNPTKMAYRWGLKQMV